MQDRHEEPITIRVNGTSVVTTVTSIDALLDDQGFGDMRVATALNGAFVASSARQSTALEDGDEIEIVSARQGG